jgi:hypothetical protein
MLKLSKSVLSFGAGALAVVALMLAAPRAAHAIAATLVQVTNTPANPAIAQSPTTQAAQLLTLELSRDPIPGSGYSYFFPVTFAGAGVDFIVPANQSFVITDIDLTPSGCSSATPGLFLNSNPTSVLSLTMAFLQVPSGISTHLEYRSGFVFPPGSTPGGSMSQCTETGVFVHGYLTSN